MLDDKELDLAKHLKILLADNEMNSGKLILEIIPVYWETDGDKKRTIEPDGIYRPLFYVHMYGGLMNFENFSRSFLCFLSGHLECCLIQLILKTPVQRNASKPYGQLVHGLMKKGKISESLGQDLLDFNGAVNVPSKHFGAYQPTNWLDERTFAIEEASYAFVLTRHLSIQLFTKLESSGVKLPHKWPEFNDDWLSQFPPVERILFPKN